MHGVTPIFVSYLATFNDPNDYPGESEIQSRISHV